METKEPVLAMTDPHVHNAIAIAVSFRERLSLNFGAKAIPTIAPTEMMLYAIDSDHTVGDNRCSSRYQARKQTPEILATRMLLRIRRLKRKVIGEAIDNKKPATVTAAGFL